MIDRRTVLLGAPALAISATLIKGVRAQTKYPEKPVKIIIGNAPGGDDDTLSRFLADIIKTDLNGTVVVENRGGGATTVGGTAVATAAPDGYTLLCLTTSGIVQTVLRDNLQYGLDDFSPIVGIGGYPMALVVSASSGITNVEQLVQVANSSDGITFASAGAGTLAHLNAVRFLKRIGVKGIHVSYKNNPEGLQALAGGFTQMMFPSAREAATLRGDGTLKVLAVTSEERTANMPDVPTMRELGYPEINPKLWYGYMAPKGTPDDVVALLAKAITKGVESEAFKKRFAPLSFEKNIRTSEDLRAFMTAEAARWAEVIQENNIRFTD